MSNDRIGIKHHVHTPDRIGKIYSLDFGALGNPRNPSPLYAHLVDNIQDAKISSKDEDGIRGQFKSGLSHVQRVGAYPERTLVHFFGEAIGLAAKPNRCCLKIPSVICSNGYGAQPTFELNHNYIRELIERRIHEGLVPDPAKLRAELARLPVINGFHKFNHVLCGLLGMMPKEVMPAIDHIDADINEQVGVLIKRAFALFPSLSDLKPFPVVWEWTYFESAQDFHAEAASLHFTQIMAVVFDHLEGRVIV